MLNIVGNFTTSVISKWGTFSPFSFIVIFLLVLRSIFIVSGVMGFRYSVFILNVIVFSILFTYVFIGRL